MIIQNIGTRWFTDLSFTVSTEDVEKTGGALGDDKNQLSALRKSFCDENIARSACGRWMRSHAGMPVHFSKPCRRDINIGMISTSEIKVSVVVAQDRAAERSGRSIKRFKLGG